MIAADMYYNMSGYIPKLLDIIMPTFKTDEIFNNVDDFKIKGVTISNFQNTDYILCSFKIFNKENKSYENYEMYLKDLETDEQTIMNELSKICKKIQSKVIRDIIE